jgi:hypothetical protein
MCPVDCHTFFAVSVIPARLLAAAVVFMGIFFAKFCRKFFLES